MALKLTKSGINLDTKETEEKGNKPPFVSVELTKRGYQSIAITEKNAKRTRRDFSSTTTTEGTGETTKTYYSQAHNDDDKFDGSPCLFTNNDGVSVLKEIISYFDDDNSE